MRQSSPANASALVQLKGTQGYSRIEVIGLPTLERLRSIKLGADRDRLVFSGTHLVERKESLGLVGVKLWALDDILASSSEAVPQPAADDSSEEEVVEAMHTLVPPKAGLVGPKCTAISSSVVAASFCQVNSVHCWEVYCWDVNTRELLLQDQQLSRNHPHFHPNGCAERSEQVCIHSTLTTTESSSRPRCATMRRLARGGLRSAMQRGVDKRGPRDWARAKPARRARVWAGLAA